MASALASNRTDAELELAERETVCWHTRRRSLRTMVRLGTEQSGEIPDLFITSWPRPFPPHTAWCRNVLQICGFRSIGMLSQFTKCRNVSLLLLPLLLPRSLPGTPGAHRAQSGSSRFRLAPVCYYRKLHFPYAF